MATAAELTIAEVEELVEPGELDPDHIVTPGIYVNRMVVGEKYVKPIEAKFLSRAGGRCGVNGQGDGLRDGLRGSSRTDFM